MQDYNIYITDNSRVLGIYNDTLADALLHQRSIAIHDLRNLLAMFLYILHSATPNCLFFCNAHFHTCSNKYVIA